MQARLLEHNVRFGDPECQCLMMRLRSDLLEVLLAAADGKLAGTHLQWIPNTALTVSAPLFPQFFLDFTARGSFLAVQKTSVLYTWPKGMALIGFCFLLYAEGLVCAVQVVMAARGYPGSYTKGSAIRNLEAVTTAKASSFCCCFCMTRDCL